MDGSPSDRRDGSVVRPPPLRTDGSNAFARHSMQERVPRILEQVLADNGELPAGSRERVQGLIRDIVADQPIGGNSLPAPDEAEWRRADAENAGATWLASPWFYAEWSVYRRLLGACRYWETGLDPFAAAKHRELTSDSPWQVESALLDLACLPAPERLHALLALSLWGNRVDLSYAVGMAFGRAGAQEDWLVDDRAAIVDHATSGDVHIVTDNTGSELAMDLALADTWTTDFGARVTLHVKMQPTFVSDATAADVWSMLRVMATRGAGPAGRAERLRAAFAGERLRVFPDFFWNGPCFLWELPERLADEVAGATLVVLKGDANYRRAVGDAVWPGAVGFAEATSYFPAPLACLRTMKSDALVGVPRALMNQLDARDPAWRVNGRRGLVQVNGPKAR